MAEGVAPLLDDELPGAEGALSDRAFHEEGVSVIWDRSELESKNWASAVGCTYSTSANFSKTNGTDRSVEPVVLGAVLGKSCSRPRYTPWFSQSTSSGPNPGAFSTTSSFSSCTKNLVIWDTITSAPEAQATRTQRLLSLPLFINMAVCWSVRIVNVCALILKFSS